MPYLTIREASDRTGHSTHKIRRLIKGIAEQASDPDRADIEPAPADAARLRSEGVQFTWRTTEELVRRRLGNVAATSSPGAERGGESDHTLPLLQQALAQFADQLKKKDDQIAALNERLRESNVLMASLQRQLPEGKKGIAAPEKPKPVPAKKTKRKSWLRGIFS